MELEVPSTELTNQDIQDKECLVFMLSNTELPEFHLSEPGHSDIKIFNESELAQEDKVSAVRVKMLLIPESPEVEHTIPIDQVIYQEGSVEHCIYRQDQTA